jgi:SAM-dependent methyltransferase
MTPEAAYWNNRFKNHDTPWDTGAVSTPLKTYIDQLTDKSIAILIPGCGNAYEAAYLLQNGFTRVTVIDISPDLTQRLTAKFTACTGSLLTVVTGDFFDLKGQYDLIIEQTFFCALDPVLREKYVVQVQALLKTSGKLAGVLFNKEFASAGPPFGGSMQEYRQFFSRYFQIKTMEPCYNSIAARAGAECFFIAVNKESMKTDS